MCIMLKYFITFNQISPHEEKRCLTIALILYKLLSKLEVYAIRISLHVERKKGVKVNYSFDIMLNYEVTQMLMLLNGYLI